jgi:two-component system sensor histidine kinase/response regulator
LHVLRVNPYRTADNRIDGAVVVLLDVDQVKRAEEALRASERRFRAVFDQQFQFMAILNPNGMVIEANDTCLQATGFPPDQVLGRRFLETPWFDRFPADQERLRRGVAESASGDRPVTGEVEFAISDGTSRVARFALTGLKDDAGEVVSVIVQGEDITEGKQAEEAFRESEVRFRGTFENAAVGIAHKDVNGRFLRVNEMYCEIVGYTREELLARTFHDITYPADLAAELEQYTRLMRGELSSDILENRYIRKDKSLVWIDVTLSLQRDSSDRPAYAIAVLQEITERKRLMEELRPAKEAAEEANRSKDQFLANVSHEIRTPFGAILGMTDLVLDTTLTDDQRDCLETVKSAADSLLGIVDDLLDFEKIEAGKMELDLADLSLRQAVDDCLRPLVVPALAKGLKLVCKVAPEVPVELVGDAGRPPSGAHQSGRQCDQVHFEGRGSRAGRTRRRLSGRGRGRPPFRGERHRHWHPARSARADLPRLRAGG